MLRRPKRSKNEVVAPKEEKEDEIMWKSVVETDRPQMAVQYGAANMQ
jgi:hypothetical protein